MESLLQYLPLVILLNAALFVFSLRLSFAPAKGGKEDR